MLGFDPDTGMLTGEGPKKEEISDDRLMRDIDEFLNDEAAREALEDEEHLKQLLIVQVDILGKSCESKIYICVFFPGQGWPDPPSHCEDKEVAKDQD